MDAIGRDYVDCLRVAANNQDNPNASGGCDNSNGRGSSGPGSGGIYGGTLRGITAANNKRLGRPQVGVNGKEYRLVTTTHLAILRAEQMMSVTSKYYLFWWLRQQASDPQVTTVSSGNTCFGLPEWVCPVVGVLSALGLASTSTSGAGAPTQPVTVPATAPDAPPDIGIEGGGRVVPGE